MTDTQFEEIAKKLLELDKRLTFIEDHLTGFKRYRSPGSLDTPDPLLEDAITLVRQHDMASASLLQRRLAIGYARAARLLDQLTEKGIIGMADGAKPRKVLIKHES